MRLVTHDEALRTFPRLYERVGRTRPGMIVRSRDWWAIRRLDDRPEQRRGAGPLVHALLERDGRPVGYALYRLAQEGSTPETWTKTIRVVEAVGIDDAATRDVWRFLLQIDWTDRVAAYHLPVDHPLPLLVDRVNKLRLSVWDALWLRVVDVPAALAGQDVRVGRPRHRRGRVRPALPRERRHVDGRGWGRTPRPPPPGRPRGGRRARLRVPRRDLVRAARARRTRGRGRPGRHRTGRRGLPRVGGAVVRRDLLIVVTGASGRVGGLVARELGRRGLPLRAVTRNVERLPDLGGVEIALAGYDEPDTLMDALAPGDRVFMVSMHEPPERRIALHKGFVDVAARRRVAHIVYLSFVGAGPGASFVHARSHGATEAMLADSGVPFTAVRNGMYADEVASWFDASGRITGPGGDGRISLTYRPELAEAIAVLLADPSHDDRRAVTITGPESFTLAELAAVASDVTGDTYRYEPLGEDEWIAYRRSVGRPEWSIEAGYSYYDGVRRGEADVVTDDYRELTGKSPLPIREMIALHRDEMPLSRAADA